MIGDAAHAILAAFFRVIHPGDPGDYVRERRRDALARWELARFTRGNSALIDAFESHCTVTVRTGCRVIALAPDAAGVTLAWNSDGQPEQARAARVILATPAPEAHQLVRDAGASNAAADFLAGIRYGAGLVVTLILRDAGPPPCDYIVCPEDSINTFFLQPVMESGGDLVVTACLVDRQAMAWADATDAQLIELAWSRLRSMVPSTVSKAALAFGAVCRWPAVGPVIAPESYAGFSNACLRPFERVILAGDYTWWNRQRMPYGMQAAIASGQRAADLVCREYRSPPICFQAQPLAITQAIALTGRGPRLEDRVTDGTVAYHGLLLAADPTDRERAQYLAGESEGDLWAYQQGYGVTALDSALVMEGLLIAGGYKALLRRSAHRLVDVFHDPEDGGFRTIPLDRVPRAPYWLGTDCPATACCAWLLWRSDSDAYAPVIEAAAIWLQRKQLVTGGWPGKWFPSDTIQVFYAMRLLLARDDRFQAACERASVWLLSEQSRDGSWKGSVIETAAAMLALSLHPDRQTPAIRCAGDWLRQRGPSGLWPGEPILHYWFEDQGRTTFFHTTDTGHITSAWARLALAACEPWCEPI
jgi:predicted NAD/FAD-dependent oxidoreductase